MSKSKYKAKPVVIDGIRFASQKEGRRYSELKLLERAGEITSLKLQPEFPVCINGKVCFKYLADFQYLEDSKRVVEDVKSPATRKLPVYRIKKKCVEAYYGFQIREV